MKIKNIKYHKNKKQHLSNTHKKIDMHPVTLNYNNLLLIILLFSFYFSFADVSKNKLLNFKTQCIKILSSLISNVKNFVEKTTKRKFFELTDGLFIGSLSLIIIKLILRMFDITPVWNINLLILGFFTFLGIYYKLMYPLRLLLVKHLFKPLLGEDFYTWKDWTNKDYDYLNESLLGLIKLPPTENNFHKLIQPYFQKLFVFLIYLRLIILKEPYLFVFIQNICIFFLISNKYLILASIISLIIASTRLCFFISDFNMEEFYISISRVENMENDESIEINKRNAKIITYWVIRELHNWNQYIKITRNIHLKKNPSGWKKMRHGIFLDKKLRDEKDEIIVKINGLNKINRRFSEYPNLPLYKIVKKHALTTLSLKISIIIILLLLVGMFSKRTEKYIELFAKHPKLWLKNETNSNWNLIEEITGNTGKYKFSPIKEIHPQRYRFLKYKNDMFVLNGNKTTVRLATTLDHHRVRDAHGPFGILSMCPMKQLNETNKTLLETTLAKNEPFIITEEQNMEIYTPFDVDRDQKLSLESEVYNDFMVNVFPLQSDLIQPHLVRIYWGFLDPTITREQAEEAIQQVLIYHKLMIGTPEHLLSSHQNLLNAERLEDLTELYNDLLLRFDSLNWNTTPNKNFNYLLNDLKVINNTISQNPHQPPIRLMRDLFSIAEGIPKERIQENFISNLTKTNKSLGGDDIHNVTYPHASPSSLALKNKKQLKLTNSDDITDID